MSDVTVGVLHPGAMGVTVGANAAEGGAAALWASEGRSEQTAERAGAGGLMDVGTVGAVAARSGIVISVCPPDAAEAVAEQVAGVGFDGVYVDANAIAPERARRIGRRIEGAGARFVDGGIIGPPAIRPGTTRLYLSGAGADEVAAGFREGRLEPIVLGDAVGAASALKMAYAAYTKGTAALLLAILGVARQEGVQDALAAEWARSQPALAEGAVTRVRNNAAKAWRFVGEMEEIAATFEAAGMPRGFHEAAGEVYARLRDYRDVEPAPALDALLDATV